MNIPLIGDVMLWLEKGGSKLRDKGGTMFMFGDEIVIASVRAQANRLKDVLGQIERDDKWRENHRFYAREIQHIERTLKKIRKHDFELLTSN